MSASVQILIDRDPSHPELKGEWTAGGVAGVITHNQAIQAVILTCREVITKATTRSFVYAETKDNKVRMAKVWPESELVTVCGGHLAADKTFVGYVRTYAVGEHMPLYIRFLDDSDTGGNAFFAGVISVIALRDGAAAALEHMSKQPTA